ncbi:hypothetical protein ACFL5F_06425 [Planctomycetota bacterium]
MDKDSTTFGLKPDKLAQLWNMEDKMDQGKNEENQNQMKAELLRDKLAQKIPLDHVVAQILPKALAQVCKDIQPFTGNSYGVLLNDPLTDITILTKIKDNNKKLAQHISSETEYDVITVIYYAAIASALIYHDQRITSFSYDHLNDKYTSLLENTWLTSDLREVFQKALNLCVQKNEE